MSGRINEPNFLREKPTRFLGYASAVGEALRHIVVSSKLLSLTRGVTLGYALVDVVRAAQANSNLSPSKIILASTDTYLFNIFASILLPPLLINRACYLTAHTCNLLQIKYPIKGSIVSNVGLALIPLIMGPLDALTNKILDNTYRKYFVKPETDQISYLRSRKTK